MTVFETIAIAFGMFSVIPMPQTEWNRRNLRFVLCVFPLVGLMIGLCSWGLAAAAEALGLPPILRGVLLSLLPVFLTGGIHLDGFADTCDARASHGSPEKRQKILRDPHTGAFAVIGLCGLFLLSAALWICLPVFRPLPILLLFCLSRTQSGLALVSLPVVPESSLAASFVITEEKKRVRRFLTVLDVLLSAGLCFCGLSGVLTAAAAQLHGITYRRMSLREFGGLSGDLAGWFLTTDELWMLAALVLGMYWEVQL